MKKFSVLLFVIVIVFVISSCNTSTSNAKTEAVSDDKNIVQAAPEMKVEGNTLSYGDHTYSVNGTIDFNSIDHKKPTASVSFSNVPADYAEFEAIYNNLLGKSPQGVAAMIPMAIELYARDAAVGKQCFDLICSSSSDDVIRILKTKLVPSEYSTPNDSYIQRYMAAALLKGANNKNAYTPDEPYTVEMCSSPNGVKEAPLSGGTVYYLYILADGWDTFQRGIDVIQPYNSDYYKLSNFAAAYSQCKNIVGAWPGLK